MQLDLPYFLSKGPKSESVGDGSFVNQMEYKQVVVVFRCDCNVNFLKCCVR